MTDIEQKVCECLIQAGSTFREDQKEAYRRAIAKEPGTNSCWVMQQVLDNALVAEKNRGPLCDDTGIPHIFIEIGPNRQVTGDVLAQIHAGIEAGLRKLPEKTDDSKKLTAKRTAFNDPDVLAYSVYEDDMQTALIFSRTSGTEDKNAVYLKCRPTLKDMLLPIADALCSHHREKMRNKESTEFMIMQKADKLFAAKGFVEEKDLTDDVQLAIAVLHALEREGKNYKRLFTD